MNNITGHKNVCTEVVDKNLCIGCGICAAICPRQNLSIEFNKFGEYVATEKGTKCPDACDICLKVCPFSNNEENEDTLGKRLFENVAGIKYKAETGSYLESFVGYSNINGHRENGASGGLATWTLEKLLTDNLVDHVACVSPNDNPEKLFKFKICNTPEEVRECSRSCYYPVETSEVIKHILSHDGRYAIIGLPCVCKAIRLAIQVSPKLKRRIKFVLGLVCGQTKSKFFAEYICTLGGGDPHNLQKVTFRIKDPNRPAADFGMKFVCGARTNAALEGVVYWTEGMNQAWLDRYFTHNACNFCDDVFAECADMVFMDAWLPRYSYDPKGHNILLVRNRALIDLLRDGSKQELVLETLTVDDAIRSQLSVLDAKRGGLRYRAKLAGSFGKEVPTKRISLCRRTIHPLIKLVAMNRWLLSQHSGPAWLGSNKDVQLFNKKLKHTLTKLERAKKTMRLLRMPSALFRKLLSIQR